MYKKDKNFTERRKYKRYKVKEGAFAAIDPNYCQLIGQIADISMGGLAFTYIDDLDGSDESEHNLRENTMSGSSSTMLLSSFDYYVEDIPFTTVEDVKVNDNIAFSFIKLRKMRVQFNGLTSKQAFNLSFYMKSNIIEKFDDPF